MRVYILSVDKRVFNMKAEEFLEIYAYVFELQLNINGGSRGYL